jgi:hypothetical protein
MQATNNLNSLCFSLVIHSIIRRAESVVWVWAGNEV